MGGRGDVDKGCCPDTGRRGTEGEFWKVVAMMADMGAGVGTVAALLACKSDNVRSVSRAIALLDTMVHRGGNMCHDAVQTLCQLISLPSPSRHGGETNEVMDWDWGKLLPSGLFSANPAGMLELELLPAVALLSLDRAVADFCYLSLLLCGPNSQSCV